MPATTGWREAGASAASLPTQCAAGGPDNSYADFLLGLPAAVAVGQPIHFHLVNSLGAGFVQDDFLAGHGLTLNLGLRYEVVTPRGDRTGGNNVNFDKVTGTPEIGTNYNTYWGVGDLNPRFGFAWQPRWAPNTVFRGAYDISSYMEGNGISNMAVINPPNTLQISQIYNSGTDYPTIHAFPGILALPDGPLHRAGVGRSRIDGDQARRASPEK